SGRRGHPGRHLIEPPIIDINQILRRCAGRTEGTITMNSPHELLRTINQQAQPYQRYREMSIEDMLLENRIIFLAGPINERSASIAIMRMLYLQSIKKDQPIHLYISSPGGLVDQTLAIY